MKYKKTMSDKSQTDHEWVQDETLELTTKSVFVFDQSENKFVGFARNIKDAKEAIFRLKEDNRAYGRFAREESGVWTYVPRSTRILEKIYLIGTQIQFHRECLGEIVDEYAFQCLNKQKEKQENDA